MLPFHQPRPLLALLFLFHELRHVSLQQSLRSLIEQVRKSPFQILKSENYVEHLVRPLVLFFRYFDDDSMKLTRFFFSHVASFWCQSLVQIHPVK